MINKDRLIDNFIDLIKINSPSFKEREIASAIEVELCGSGCEVVFQDYGESINLIAYKKGTNTKAPVLVLNAHMDTVEDTEAIRFEVTEDRIRSTGHTVLGSDDKSGIAQILEALKVVDELSIPHGDIEVVLTSAEEKGLVGAKHLENTLIKGRHALVLDSGGPVGNVIIGAPTHITYTITITGKAAHAGIEPEKGLNSIRVASEIITSIPDGRIDASTTANVGIINGGTATNIVPKETMIKGEFRSHRRETLERLRQGIFDTARTIAHRLSAPIEITDKVEYESFFIHDSDPFLKLVAGAHKRCGITPTFTITGGGSDANIFNSKGIRAINISNGMQMVHSPEEFILIEDLIKGAEIIVEVIRLMGEDRQ